MKGVGYQFCLCFRFWGVISLMGASLLFADVSSTTGTLNMDVEGDGLAEASLGAQGFALGKLAASANLDVAGNAVITTALSVGSASQGSSNLNLTGSWSNSYATLSSNASLTEHSTYLLDASAGNFIVQLPPSESTQGRILHLKKVQTTGEITLAGGIIDNASSMLVLPSGNLWAMSLVNSANVWYPISSYALGTTVGKRKIFHATFDEASPNAPVDSVYGWTGIHNNMASANIGVAGNIGNAVDLDGDSPSGTGDFVTFKPGGASESVYDTQLFTLSARIYPRHALHTEHQAIIKRGNNDTMTYRFGLKASNNLMSLRVTFADGTSTAQTVSTSSISMDAWSHVAGTHDGSNLQIYINGVADGSPKATGRTLVNGSDKGLDIGGSAGDIQNFRGLIDDVRVYNYALSAAEILQLYQGTFD